LGGRRREGRRKEGAGRRKGRIRRERESRLRMGDKEEKKAVEGFARGKQGGKVG